MRQSAKRKLLAMIGFGLLSATGSLHDTAVEEGDLAGTPGTIAAGETDLDSSDALETVEPRYSEKDDFVPTELFVTFVDGTPDEDIGRTVEDFGATVISRFRFGTATLLVRLPAGITVAQAAETLAENAGISHTEPNFIYRAATIPDDPHFPDQWGLHNTGRNFGTPDVDINAPEAWQFTTGDKDIVIGVIDTGISTLDFDLQGNLWRNPGEIPGNGLDDDGNGWVDDIYGINTILENAEVLDDDGHGTQVAGIIGARGNNSRAVAGVMWDVSIASCKFLNQFGSGTLDDALQCIEYFRDLKDAGVNIVATNNSWGNHQFSTLLQVAINAHDTRDILFVAAAGNDSQSNDFNPTYPASYPGNNIIAVAAIDRNGSLAAFSNFGAQSVDIAAPGVDIVTTSRGNQIAFVSGTSMAAPFVTGVAGLLKAQSPVLSMTDIRQEILSSGVSSAELQGKVANGMRLRADFVALDTDSDGMPDFWEDRFGLDRNNPADAFLDLDSDGLTNVDEFLSLSDPSMPDTDADGLNDGDEVHVYGTDPIRADTDDDGLTDNAEVSVHLTNPLDPDSDADGLSDGHEVAISNTDPLNADSDNDGMPDGWEEANGLDPRSPDAAGDADGDGISNGDEFGLGTHPGRVDSDEDGLADGDERDIHLTDPASADSDTDGMNDGWEIANGLDPLLADDATQDPDGDGATNLEEFEAGTDPNDATSVPVGQPWSGVSGNGAQTAFVPISSVGADFRPVWQQETPYRSGRYRAVLRDLFFEFDDGAHPEQVVARRVADGLETWRADLPGSSRVSEPAISDGHVVVEGNADGTGSNVFGVFDAETGAFVRVATSANDVSTPGYYTVQSGSIFTTTQSDLVRLDISSGNEVWRTTLTDPAGFNLTHPTVNDTHVLLAQNSVVEGYDRQTGLMNFDFSTGGCPSGVGTGKVIALAGSETAFVSDGDCLFSINVTTGQANWTVLRHRWISASIGEDFVLATNDRDELVAIDRVTGQIVWVWAERALIHTVVSTKTHVFTGTEVGTSAINLVSGQEVWSISARGELALSSDGVLIVRETNSRMIAAIDVSGDLDGDGMSDYWERQNKLRHADATDATEDPDQDSLSNLDEFHSFTNPFSVDTDGDEIRDADELNVYFTDPALFDTDDDGLGDGEELLTHGSHPLSADSDGDGVRDRDEVDRYFSNPADPSDSGTATRNYYESFEFGLPAGWRASENTLAQWSAVAGEATEGSHALRSDPVAVFREALIEWAGDFVAGELVFDARVVEDFPGIVGQISVRIDGELQLGSSYTGTEWREILVPVPPGEHVISFSFILRQNVPSAHALIDNLRYHVPRPAAGNDANAVVFNGAKMWETDPVGLESRLLLDEESGSWSFDLRQANDNKVVIVQGPRIRSFDPLTNETDTVIHAGLQRPVATPFGSQFLVTDAVSDHGVAIYEPRGRYVDTVLRGRQYIDLEEGKDSFLYGLQATGGQVDKIQAADYSVVSSFNISPDARAIAVDAVGVVYSVGSNRTLFKHDAGGTLLGSLQVFSGDALTSISLGDAGQLWIGTDCSCASSIRTVGLSSTDLSGFDFLEFDFFTNFSETIPDAVSRGGTDRDGDGIPDWWERSHGLSERNAADSAIDEDGDGFTALEEFGLDTHPLLADSDFDGLTDNAELAIHFSDPLAYDTDFDGLSDGEEALTFGTDPSVRDTDNDGLTDREEVRLHSSDPLDPDTDNDSMGDGWEVDNALDPLNAADATLDPDADGLDNAGEFAAGSDILVADSDGDGLFDGEEVNIHGTSPISRDTDDDLLVDKWEIDNGLNALDANDADTDPDSDLFNNVEEFYGGSDPQSAASFPVAAAWTTHQGGPKHNGYVPFVTKAVDFRLKWTSSPLDIPSSLIHQAVSRDNVAWVVAQDGTGATFVAALDTITGARQWQSELTDAQVVSPIALSDGTVYVLSRQLDFSSDLWALDSATGALRFRASFPRADSLNFAPTPFAGNVYAVTDATASGTGITRIGGDTGTLDWFVRFFGNWNSAVTVDNGSVYYFERGRLQTVNVQTGDVAIITSEVPDTSIAREFTPVIGGFDKILGNFQDGLAQYDLDAQNLDWTVSGSFNGPPVTANGVVYATTSFDLIAFDERTGAELWRWTALPDIVGPIIVTTEHVFLSTFTDVHAISLDTHISVWSHPVQGKLSLGNNGTIFITGAAPGESPEIIAIDLAGDQDTDGMPDFWEDRFGLDKNDPSDAASDSDGDGLFNLDEYLSGTDPLDTDSDADGLTDGDEVNLHGTNPVTADSDFDGLTDFDELTTYLTDPTSADSDGDRMPDGWEVDNALDPVVDDALNDPDVDNLDNVTEYGLSTDPNNSDTDSDGMPDGWEVDNNLDPLTDDAGNDPDADNLDNVTENGLSTDPNNSDTDNDGMPDGWEVDNNLDPLTDDAAGDPDSDGISNLDEFRAGTDPHVAPPPPPPLPPPPQNNGGGGGGGAWSLLFVLVLALIRRRQVAMGGRPWTE